VTDPPKATDRGVSERGFVRASSFCPRSSGKNQNKRFAVRENVGAGIVGLVVHRRKVSRRLARNPGGREGRKGGFPDGTPMHEVLVGGYTSAKHGGSGEYTFEGSKTKALDAPSKYALTVRRGYRMRPKMAWRGYLRGNKA